MKTSPKQEIQEEEIDPKTLYTVIGKLISHKLLPVHVGQRLVVVPRESAYRGGSGEIVIRLNQDRTDAFINKEGVAVNLDGEPPQSTRANAFGSGAHPTTQLALYFLEEYIKHDDVVVDLGTGSGVLSIYAAKLGAGSVLGVDVDEIAIDIAQDNIRLNEVESIVSVTCGSLDAIKNKNNSQQQQDKFADILVANLVTPIILDLIDNDLTSVVKTHGKIILTGIQLEEYESVREKLDFFGHSIIEKREQGNWCAIVMAPNYEERE